MSAAIRKSDTRNKPSTASRLRSSRRQASPHRLRTFLACAGLWSWRALARKVIAMTTPSANQRDARVEQGIDQIHQEVADHHQQRADEHGTHDDRVVHLLQRLNREVTEAGDVEDQLDEDRAIQ